MTKTEILDRFEYMTLDTIAETVEGVPDSLYHDLWAAMVEDERNPDGDWGRPDWMTSDPNCLGVAFERLAPLAQETLLRVLKAAC